MAADLQAILTALRTDRETRDTVRRELLTEELLNLPARMEEWFAHLAALTADGFAGVSSRLGELATRMAELTGTVNRLAERMTELATKPEWGPLSRLAGTAYEVYALDPPRPVARAVGAVPARLHHVSGGQLEAVLDQAEATGRLTPEDADAIATDLKDANGLFVWDRSPQAPPLYCVVEASITAQAQDVERAVRRPEGLQRAGVQAQPVVISERTDPEAAAAVQAGRVAWRQVPQRRVKGRPPQLT